ncbi:MAG: YraN family protein [Gammaproteobacteria bacterium]|nr:YraN family protein [Gammaproteobacteria bacterium]
MKPELTIGQQAEQWACDHLQQQGLALITTNYHCRRGEIDLIMQEQKTLVFVEVRYRKSNTFGSALESVDHKKQAKLIFTAEHYLQQQTSSFSGYRFDVVAISHEKSKPVMTWVKDAFQVN